MILTHALSDELLKHYNYNSLQIECLHAWFLGIPGFFKNIIFMYHYALLSNESLHVHVTSF